MAKKRNRQQNPQPFMADDDSVATKKRSKAPKNHQKRNKLISSDMSSKILNEALIQQQEILKESTDEQNPSSLLFSAKEPLMDEEDIDNFSGFDNIPSQYGSFEEEEIDEEDEKLLEAFLSKNAAPQETLADHIVDKIKEKEALVSSELRPLPTLDNSAIELYKGVGKLLSKYTAGKIPKAFKLIPSMKNWEDVLYLTVPENWSANAMYQATRIFASNFGAREAERFYKLVLLPRIREDIRKNRRLHFSLYQSLKKALYKPGAFNKGILFPLCESRTCTLREAVIIGSVMRKTSIVQPHSSAAIVKLAQMEYCGTTSYFIKLLFEKNYSLPYSILDAVFVHFGRFLDDTRVMPVIWHLSLLAFLQRYKNGLRKEDKDSLRAVIEKHYHKLITPEILRELNNSRNRGEKEDDLMSISSPISVVNQPIEEDRFDIPEVPMED